MNKALQDEVDKTIARASDTSEMWVGTLYEAVIDTEQAQLLSAVEKKDDERVKTILYQLDRTIEKAMDAYEN